MPWATIRGHGKISTIDRWKSGVSPFPVYQMNEKLFYNRDWRQTMSIFRECKTKKKLGLTQGNHQHRTQDRITMESRIFCVFMVKSPLIFWNYLKLSTNIFNLKQALIENFLNELKDTELQLPGNSKHKPTRLGIFRLPLVFIDIFQALFMKYYNKMSEQWVKWAEWRWCMLLINHF